MVNGEIIKLHFLFPACTKIYKQENLIIIEELLLLNMLQNMKAIIKLLSLSILGITRISEIK